MSRWRLYLGVIAVTLVLSACRQSNDGEADDVATLGQTIDKIDATSSPHVLQELRRAIVDGPVSPDVDAARLAKTASVASRLPHIDPLFFAHLVPAEGMTVAPDDALVAARTLVDLRLNYSALNILSASRTAEKSVLALRDTAQRRVDDANELLQSLPRRDLPVDHSISRHIAQLLLDPGAEVDVDDDPSPSLKAGTGLDGENGESCKFGWRPLLVPDLEFGKVNPSCEIHSDVQHDPDWAPYTFEASLNLERHSLLAGSSGDSMSDDYLAGVLQIAAESVSEAIESACASDTDTGQSKWWSPYSQTAPLVEAIAEWKDFDQSLDVPSLEHALCSRDSFVGSVRFGGQSFFFVVGRNSRLAFVGGGSDVVYTLAPIEIAPNMPAVLVHAVEGSGSYLDAAVVDVAKLERIFKISSAHRGALTSRQLDGDAPLELLISEGTGIGREGCTQCPELVRTARYDYSMATSTFELSATRLSLYERAPRSWWGGSFALLVNINDAASQYPTPAHALNAVDRENEEAVDEALTNFWAGFSEQFGFLHQVGDSARMASTARSAYIALREARLPASQKKNEIESGVLIQLLTALLYNGDLDVAEQFALGEESQALQRSFPGATVDILGLQAGISMHLGHFENAFRSMQRLEALTTGEQDLPVRRANVGNRAWYFSTLGDHEEALLAGLVAVDLMKREKETMPGVPNFLHVSSSLQALGRPHHAIDWLIRAVTDGSDSHRALALQRGAELAVANNDPVLAIRMLDEAITLADSYTWNGSAAANLYVYASALEILDHADQSRLLYEAAASMSDQASTQRKIMAAVAASRLHARQGDLAQAIVWADRALATGTTSRRRFATDDQKLTFHQQLEKAANWRMDLANLADESPEKRLQISQDWKMAVLREAVGAGDSTPAHSVESAISHLGSVLRKGDVFIDFAQDGGKLVAIVVKPDSSPRLVDLGSVGTRIQSAASTIRESMRLKNPESLQAIRANVTPESLANALLDVYKVLILPLALGNDVERLLISADSSLENLPWAALRTQDDRFLGELYELAEVPSVHMIQRPASVPLLDKIAVVAREGAVHYKDPPLAPLQSLPALANVSSELEEILDSSPQGRVQVSTDAKDFRGSNWITSLPADVAALSSLWSDAAYIHVVGHGQFDLDDSMRSRLFVLGRESEPWLTASDVAKMDLRSVSVVVLSACESGSLQLNAGTEPTGFVRSFLLAGVRSVVGAQWQVDDRATAKFMGAFYRNLQTARPTKALMLAQRDVRKTWKHPFFWASFSMTTHDM